MPMALLLAYDGTDYHGYQRQTTTHGRTVQGDLEMALERLAGVPVTTTAAGRTDAGVHASGQVVTFDAASPLRFTPDDWRRALNALLDTAIAVRAACRIAVGINARRSATERSYRYRVLLDAVRDPLRERYAWRAAAQLDVAAMQVACAELSGIHDFAAFGQSPGDKASQARGHTIRDLRLAQVSQQGDEVWCDFTANAFLTGMVRRMVGTLVLVGRGQLDPADVQTILAARRRDHPGIAAPARGLCLTRVGFPSGTIVWPAIDIMEIVP